MDTFFRVDMSPNAIFIFQELRELLHRRIFVVAIDDPELAVHASAAVCN